MKVEIKVPAMGESVAEATIGQLLKVEGAAVKEGDELVELETDKVNQPLYAPASGALHWSITTGQTVRIGQVIGSIDTEAKGEAAPAKEVKAETPEVKRVVAPQSESKGGGGGRLMEEAFLSDLTAPSAAEPAKKEETKAAPASSNRRPMSKIRKTIAARLVESLHSVAMLTTFNEVDMSVVMELRARYKELFAKKHGVKLGFMSFFVKAVTDALKLIPELNSYIEGEEIVHHEQCHIGIAVGTEKGLFVPVIKRAETLSFAQIEKAIEEYATKARTGKITVDDLRGGSFTITNGGVYGSLLSTPLLNPPQSGILGMHKIEKRAVVVDDQIVIRPMMYLALSYDHRLIDGKEAISFLVRVKEVLEDPTRLILDTDL